MKNSKSNNEALSFVSASWLLLQLFDRLFQTEFYLHSYFRFNTSLQFLLVTFFVSMRRRVLALYFLKMPVNLARYRVTGGNFNYRQTIVSLHYEAPLYSGMSNSFSNQGSSNSSLIFYFFFYILFLSKGNFLKIFTKFSVPFFCSTIFLRTY